MASTQRAEETKRPPRTKRTNPLLMLLQKGFYRTRQSEYLRQKSTPETTSAAAAAAAAVSPYPEGCVSLAQLLDTRRPSCHVSISVSAATRSPARDTCTRSSWSSSWTSWTQPHRGHRPSADSCQPNTSIFDNDDVFGSAHKSREGRKLRRLESKLSRRRDSSADTSKDIDDIEDLELDEEEVEAETECVFLDSVEMAEVRVPSEAEDKRLRGFMTSPDLAYCSMDGCG